LGDQIKKNEIGWHVARNGERRDVYRVLVGKHEGKRPLGRTWHRWKDIIKMDFQEVGRRAWIGLICFRRGAGGGHL